MKALDSVQRMGLELQVKSTMDATHKCARKFTCGPYLLLRVTQNEDLHLHGNDPYLHLSLA